MSAGVITKKYSFLQVSRLRHITICNTKLAVKLCQFPMKFDRIVSILIQNVEISEFLSLLYFVRHTSEHHVLNDVRTLHRLPISA